MIEWEGALKRMYQKKVVNSNKCWESSGKARVPHSSGKGYPVIRIKVEGAWESWKMAKVMAFIARLPQLGPQVLHKCNNPECWNPDHLYWGTHLENMRDKITAGTSLRGENHNLVKLSKNQVMEIRERANNGESHMSISRDYPVKRRQVSRIVEGTRWSKS